MQSQTRRRRRATPCASPLLTTAVGAAFLAGATTLSTAFTAPGFCGDFCLGNNNSTPAFRSARAAAAASSAAATAHFCNGIDSSNSRCGPTKSRRRQLAMVSAIAEPPSVAAAGAGAGAGAAATAAATSSGGRREEQTKRRKPPLTREEEQALLLKIKEARVLRECQERLELAAAAASGRPAGGDGRRRKKSGVAEDVSAATAAGRTTVPVELWAREAGLEVEDLSRALQEGIEAKRTLVERNMPMVAQMVAGQYQWRLRGGQVSTADLLQEGAYALGVAADRFDPAMDNRFLTYALYVVRDKLDVALARGNSAISVPASALKELHRARRELAGELGRGPSEAEMANFFANGVVVDSLSAVTAAFSDEGAAAAGSGGDRVGRSRATTGGEFSITAPFDDREARQQTRTRRRRLNLLSAVQKVTSIDRLIRASDGSNMVPLVETLVGERADPPPRAGGGSGDISELLPRVLTPVQADLVRMACGLADGRPMTMAECSKELSLSVARTKSLFDSSLEKLRVAATADNPSRLAR